MATHSSFLAGKLHGQRSLAGYSPWGHKKLNKTENTHSHTNNNKSNREYLVQIFILPFFFWLLLQSVESSARWCTSPSFSAQF